MHPFMADPHPLDRCPWSALTGRHARLAVVECAARRYDPAFNVFAAVQDDSPASMADLAALVAAHGDVALLQPEAPPEAPGLAVAFQGLGVQMVWERLSTGPDPEFEILPLGAADAPEMLALATLTEPGPFAARTNELGDFFGVKVDGRLVAMAGERMKPDGYTEISGVCTHPDHRGKGYAGALMRRVGAGVQARGDIPFLHAYAANTGAIALYESLGFVLRREVLMTRLTAA